jgi:AraC-like DNA-binding protein
MVTAWTIGRRRSCTKATPAAATVAPIVEPVERDARGILAPDAGLARFRLDRFPPSAAVARFVDRYWVVTWDLTGQEPFTQRVFAHPVVNVVFADGASTVVGVTTRVGSRTLAGAGRALGIMYRPAGFRPFLGRPLSSITDRTERLAAVYGPAVAGLESEVAAAPDGAAMAAAADRFLVARLPAGVQASEATSGLVERIAADPSFVRVEAVAAEAGVGVRALQRRFLDHVGLNPKAVIRRYRLYEAAERARHGTGVDWAGLAVELGYSDQAHLTRDFSATLGMPPDRYARTGGLGG